MRWILLLGLILAGCVAKDSHATEQSPLPKQMAPPLPSFETQLDYLTDPDNATGKFSRFEMIPIPGPTETYAAICDSCYMWWGTLFVFDVVGGRVTNVRAMAQVEHCVYQARCIALEGIREPLLEAYGMTHMGHGNYYLYRVTNEELVPLVETGAVDFHEDMDLIRGGLLRPDYEDVNGDGFRDVTLAGTRDYVVEDDGKDSHWTRSERAKKCFLYDPITAAFHEDKSRREGTRYQD